MMRSLISQLLAIGPELAAFILTSPLLASRGAYAISPDLAPSPNLDLSKLGRVAVAGDFDSISIYQYEGQNENLLSFNGSLSLLTQYPNGAFESLASSDAYISAMCQFERNGKIEGVVVGGNFTALGGVMAQSVALWDPSTNSVTPLPGINGVVSSLYCDSDDGTVYVGGTFSASHSQNAMSWTTGWEDLPFAGFNGPVYSIDKNANGNIVFGGQFDGLGNTTTAVTSNSQVVNLGGGQISAEGTTSTMPGFEDPSNIICQTGEDGPGNTWLLADNRGGFWNGNFDFGFIPTKLRLYNTKYQGRGTKSFALENLANGGFLEFNFTDSNGNTQQCAGSCPLPEGTTEGQDFFFTQPVGCSGFRLWINDWYGDGAGLSGIEMFQDDIYSFAINSYNEPTCDSVSNAATSYVSPSSGLWYMVQNNGSTTSNYLAAYLTDASQQTNSTSIVFNPNIPESGNYSITVYTPGCVPDDTCDTRGAVELVGSTTSDGSPVTATITQTNDYDKYDQIYFGYVDASNSDFQPSVTLTPIAGAALPQTIVAQRVRFDLVTTTGGLNGLYEYNPNQANINKNFKTSVIDSAGTSLNSGAVINSIIWDSDKGYAAGDFKGNGMSNVITITNKASSLTAGGLNAPVEAMYLSGSTLYLGGNFTDTADSTETGLNNVASYDTGSDKWVPLGNGVDGSVTSIVPLELNVTAGNQETCIAFSGDFSSVNAYNGHSSFNADRIAVWVPSKNNWLDNVANVAVGVQGMLLTSTKVSGMDLPLYGGQAQVEMVGLNGAVELLGSGEPTLQTFGLKVQDSTTTSAKQKRETENTDYSGITAGLFVDQDGFNVTALGGHFEVSGSNGESVRNIAIMDTKGSTRTISGVSQLDNNATVKCFAYANDYLFAGGAITGELNGDQIEGFTVYDMQHNKLVSPQPPALAGSNVVVNAIAPQEKTSLVYVGGNFKYAGALSCETLCVYDTTRQQWNTPGLGLSGTITSMVWSSKTTLVIAGDLSINGAKTYLATYNSKAQNNMFTAFSGASTLPGSISVLTPANSDFSNFWASGTASKNGSTYLALYQNNRWTTVGGLGSDTTIRGLQVMPLTSSHSSTSLVPSSDALMVLGNIAIRNFGNASAALFNGTDFTPFLLSTQDDGSQGTASQIFVSNPQNLLSSSNHHLAIGFVVLIGLAIALALIFLLVVAGILIERTRRRSEGYVPMRNQRNNGNLSRIPPESLLQRLSEKGSPPKL